MISVHPRTLLRTHEALAARMDDSSFIQSKEKYMSLKLSVEDEQMIAKLRSAGVLKSVRAKKMHAPNGFMAFVCSDCDHIRDKFEFLSKLCEDQSGSERVHLFSCHSGGMLLSPSSPTKKGAEHQIFKEHIADAMELKGLELLVSKCHAPCGAAYAKGLNFHHVLHHTFLGKTFVKVGLPNLRVAVFAQIHHSDGRKRTYSIEGKDWWKYAELKGLF